MTSTHFQLLLQFYPIFMYTIFQMNGTSSYHLVLKPIPKNRYIYIYISWDIPCNPNHRSSTPGTLQASASSIPRRAAKTGCTTPKRPWRRRCAVPVPCRCRAKEWGIHHEDLGKIYGKLMVLRSLKQLVIWEIYGFYGTIWKMMQNDWKWKCEPSKHVGFQYGLLMNNVGFTIENWRFDMWFHRPEWEDRYTI